MFGRFEAALAAGWLPCLGFNGWERPAFTANPPAPESAIRAAEEALGLRLPDDFRRFLRQWNGASLFVDSRGEAGIRILAAQELVGARDEFLSWYDPSERQLVLPFADVQDSNCLAFDCRTWHVLAGDHEVSPGRWRAIAPTFAAWLDQTLATAQAHYVWDRWSLDLSRPVVYHVGLHAFLPDDAPLAQRRAFILDLYHLFRPITLTVGIGQGTRGPYAGQDFGPVAEVEPFATTREGWGDSLGYTLKCPMGDELFHLLTAEPDTGRPVRFREVSFWGQPFSERHHVLHQAEWGKRGSVFLTDLDLEHLSRRGWRPRQADPAS